MIMTDQEADKLRQECADYETDKERSKAIRDNWIAAAKHLIYHDEEATVKEAKMLTIEHEKEIRNFLSVIKPLMAKDSKDLLINSLEVLLAEIDRLRAENAKLSGALLKFGGKNAGHIWGLANCYLCAQLDNDYYFIGKATVCKECFESFSGDDDT